MKIKPTTHTLIPHQIHYQHISYLFYRRRLLYLKLCSILFPQFFSSSPLCWMPSLTKKPLRWLVLSPIGYQKQNASLTTRSTPKNQQKYTSNPSLRAIHMKSCALLLPRHILQSPAYSHSQKADMSQSGKTGLHSQSTQACYTGNYHTKSSV